MRLTDELFGIVLENQRREMLRFVAGYEVAKSADASALYLHVLYQNALINASAAPLCALED